MKVKFSINIEDQHRLHVGYTEELVSVYRYQVEGVVWSLPFGVVGSARCLRDRRAETAWNHIILKEGNPHRGARLPTLFRSFLNKEKNRTYSRKYSPLYFISLRVSADFMSPHESTPGP